MVPIWIYGATFIRAERTVEERHPTLISSENSKKNFGKEKKEEGAVVFGCLTLFPLLFLYLFIFQLFRVCHFCLSHNYSLPFRPKLSHLLLSLLLNQSLLFFFFLPCLSYTFLATMSFRWLSRVSLSFSLSVKLILILILRSAANHFKVLNYNE